VLLAAVALVLAACATAGPGAPLTRHLVLISVDALQPRFYLDPSFDAPTLRAMIAEGSHARAVESVFPTVTYPSHTTIVSGVRPATHGIHFNLLFDPAQERTRWFEETTDLRATTLWMWARAAGLKTASVTWPVTFGASIDWLLPERDYHVRPNALDDLLAATTPGLLDRLGLKPEATMFRAVERWDEFTTTVAAGIIRLHQPNLLLLHLVETDAVQHSGGPNGPRVKPAVTRVDGRIAELRRAVADAGIADRTTFIVTGDHGFQEVKEYVYPNHVLSRAGLRACPRSGGWRVTAHIAGGGAAIFADTPADRELVARAEAALRAEAADRYVVLTRAELDALGTMPGAVLGLEALPGWALGTSCDRGLTEPPRAGFGTHGFLPSRPSMATGFIAAGAGVRAGVALERARLIDVAPTAARLLGIPVPAVEGRVLREILK
jgi:predicted AlkP superfamily pyrophosphatase or phosphodiesterase